MSKATHKNTTVALTVAANQVLGTLDITNCNGACVQLNSLAATAGSMKLQRSLDNTNWEDIASATKTLTASGVAVANTINISAEYSGHIRALVTLSGGAGDYDFFMLGKER
jgi:hypothetical protein